jgi:hypothetical protein
VKADSFDATANVAGTNVGPAAAATYNARTVVIATKSAATVAREPCSKLL